MTDHTDMTDVITRLERFGEELDVDGIDVSAAVVDRITTDRTTPSGRSWLVAAAIVLVVAATVVVAHPDSRHAVARWFGFDGLVVEVDPELSAPGRSDDVGALGPGDSRTVVVDDRQILVSVVNGRLSDGLITKTVGSSDQVDEVVVADHRGLWISGEPHELLYETTDGGVEVERFAANTLVWEDDDTLYRVEGFATLDQAIAFAEDNMSA